MEITLSILIATMPKRKASLNYLLNVLKHNKKVEIITDDSMEYNIGVKRNKLLDQAQGEYIVFIDDDDIVSKDYISKILTATETKPDCIGISGLITFDGSDTRKWHISKDYGKWYQDDATYYRTPNHISPVRRELALKARFPNIAFAEDFGYSMRLLPLLKTEVIIPGSLYFYQYETTKN